MAKNKELTYIQWKSILRKFCLEDDCFIVDDPAWNKFFLQIDTPLNRLRGNHYFKVNAVSTHLGNRVERGKKNLIVHKEIAERLKASMSERGKDFPNDLLIPFSFDDIKAYKERANEFKSEVREKYNKIFEEKMKIPAYAKVVLSNRKRDDWIKNAQKENKKNSTYYENVLYNTALKKFGKRVKRQFEITVNDHIYFPDFYIKSLKLVIEVDGGYHSTAEQSAKDRERDLNLASIGIKTIRIKNEQVSKKSCRDELLRIIQSRKKLNGTIPDTSTNTHFIGI